jgi:hypothetical protein
MISQYLYQLVVAPIAFPLVGSKKLLATIFPLDCRAWVTRLVSMLLKLEFFQVVPSCHELPDADWLPVSVICEEDVVVPLLTAAMQFSISEVLEANLKPTSPLFQAVLRVRVKLPVWLLSVKPLAALLKAKQLVMTWSAAPMSAASPPPSLKPLPSPSKELNPQRLKPLPHERVSLIVMADVNSL